MQRRQASSNRPHDGSGVALNQQIDEWSEAGPTIPTRGQEFWRIMERPISPSNSTIPTKGYETVTAGTASPYGGAKLHHPHERSGKGNTGAKRLALRRVQTSPTRGQEWDVAEGAMTTRGARLTISMRG